MQHTRRPALAILLCAALVAGCHSKAPGTPSEAQTTVLQALSDGPDSLVGQYGVDAGTGTITPQMRITHAGAGSAYLVEESTPAGWRPRTGWRTGKPSAAGTAGPGWPGWSPRARSVLPKPWPSRWSGSRSHPRPRCGWYRCLRAS